MKIYVGDDLHLEFEKGNRHTLRIPEDGDVLVLAGDIFTPWLADDKATAVFHSFFSEVSEKFDKVIIIPGNHEYYGGSLLDTPNKIKEFLAPYENIVFLNNSTFEYKGVLFWGSTFWTDIRNSDPLIIWDVKRCMNDYNEIYYSFNSSSPYSGGPQKIIPDDTINENHYARASLREALTTAVNGNLLPFIITHHAPSERCIDYEYGVDVLSYAYANTGLDFILDGEDEEFIWVHGHMHKRDIIQCGGGPIICNARGYHGHDPRVESFNFLLIDLPVL